MLRELSNAATTKPDTDEGLSPSQKKLISILLRQRLKRGISTFEVANNMGTSESMVIDLESMDNGSHPQIVKYFTALEQARLN